MTGAFIGPRRAAYVRALADAELLQEPNDTHGLLRRIAEIRAAVAQDHEEEPPMTTMHYRSDQAITSVPWAPGVLDGPQGLRQACEKLELRTLSDLSGAWHTNAEKVRNLLGNAPSRVAAVKATLAKVANPDKKEPEKPKPAPVRVPYSDPNHRSREEEGIAEGAELARMRESQKPAEEPAQTAAVWPPRMPEVEGESESRAATRQKKSKVLALAAKGKSNREIEEALGLGKNYVASARKDPVFMALIEKARAGKDVDPQASAVTEKLPPRPEPAEGPRPEPEADDPHQVPAGEIEDGPADDVTVNAPGPRFSYAPVRPRTFQIPLDAIREAELTVPSDITSGDMDAIGEYLEFLSGRLKARK